MLATLAIINMAVATALITETAEARAVQEPTAITTTVDTSAQSNFDYSWAEE